MDSMRRSLLMARLAPEKPFLWKAISIHKMIKVHRRQLLNPVKMKA